MITKCKELSQEELIKAKKQCPVQEKTLAFFE
jgi:hypothetical protein